MPTARLIRIAVASAIFIASLSATQTSTAETVIPDQTGTGQSGGELEVWRANTRKAFASQGSTCPWRYAGTINIPSTDASIGDAVDPTTGRLIRLFTDCNNVIYEVLEPAPRDVAEYLWEQVRATIPTSKIGIEPVDDRGAIVKVDNWYWLETGSEPITATGSLLGATATITATPSLITSDWGDGTITTCDAPGLDFNTNPHPTLLRDPDPAPPGGCSYKYLHNSSKQPNRKFFVTHAITWNATWTTSDGLNGTFEPVTRQTTTQLAVDNINSILGKAP
jgi:hypothetical protein